VAAGGPIDAPRQHAIGSSEHRSNLRADVPGTCRSVLASRDTVAEVQPEVLGLPGIHPAQRRTASLSHGWDPARARSLVFYPEGSAVFEPPNSPSGSSHTSCGQGPPPSPLPFVNAYDTGYDSTINRFQHTVRYRLNNGHPLSTTPTTDFLGGHWWTWTIPKIRANIRADGSTLPAKLDPDASSGSHRDRPAPWDAPWSSTMNGFGWAGRLVAGLAAIVLLGGCAAARNGRRPQSPDRLILVHPTAL